MSRAYKKKVLDDIADMGGTNFATVARTEKMSGADIAQALLTAQNGDTTTVAASGVTTHGQNSQYGTKVSSALSGADLERFAGDQ